MIVLKNFYFKPAHFLSSHTNQKNCHKGHYSKLGDLDKVRACIKDGANINWTNPDSKTLTHPGGETCLIMATRGDWQNPRKHQVIEKATPAL